jgi:hypothetical protein
MSGDVFKKPCLDENEMDGSDNYCHLTRQLQAVTLHSQHVLPKLKLFSASFLVAMSNGHLYLALVLKLLDQN